MSGQQTLRKALALAVAKRLTFAAFRAPGQPVQLWAQRTPELETVDGTLLLGLNQVFLLAPFHLDHRHVPFIRADVELRFAEIDPDIEHLQECSGCPDQADRPTHVAGQEEYMQAVAGAMEACIRRDLDKVVLSRVLETPLDLQQWPDLFIRAMEDAPENFICMAHAPATGLWFGTSPERLVLEEADHVRVDAMAATRPADAVPERISGWGEKELDEQAQVACQVHATFARMDLQRIVMRGPEVVRAGPVAHLRSTLEADLGDRLLGDLVLALHPTPATCGAPREAALAFIRRTERHDRSLYAGFWGPWNAEGPTELFVNLRCMQAGPGTARLHVGGGITAGSDPLQEWTETRRKADTLLRLMDRTAATDQHAHL